MIYKGNYKAKKSYFSNLCLTVGRIYANSVIGISPIKKIFIKNNKIYISRKKHEELVKFIEKDLKKLDFGLLLCEKALIKERLFVDALKEKNINKAARFLRDLNALYVLFSEYYLDVLLEKKEKKFSEKEIAEKIPEPLPNIVERNKCLNKFFKIKDKKKKKTKLEENAEVKILQIGQTISNDIFYVREVFLKSFKLPSEINLEYFFSLLNNTQLTGREIIVNEKVGGEAIIVNDYLDKLWKPENMKGKILIAEKTYPDFLPYMLESKRIITEQGGLLSHAAIVSREYKIPTIIGIENITNIVINGEKLIMEKNKIEIYEQGIKINERE